MRSRAITGLLLAATLPALPSPPRFDKHIPKDDEALHAVSRLTFGPRPGDLEAVRRIGVRKWIDRQLNPTQIPESPDLETRLRPLTSLTMSQREIIATYPPSRLIKATGDGKSPKTRSPAPRALMRDLYEQKLYRAVYSDHQLEEVLTDFWFNHFNVYLGKGADRFLVTSYERDAIRPHVLGRFHELLVATAKHPAMLFYLDNWRSAGPDASGMLARRNRGLNENYARELLELHTLGVDGGYTQQDVIEVARCFTGWTIAEPYRRAEFSFNPRAHDRGAKVVLRVTIPPAGGQEDGLKVLDLLARHPSTARFLCTKLAQRFVADDPPETLIKTMSETFRKTDGDLKAVMRTMLNSREFWSQAAYKAKVKSPLEMVASALRATGADVTSALGVANRIGDLGQPLYRKQEPTGYSNRSSDWVNSAALLGRMNFALDLVQNKLSGVRVDTTRFNSDLNQVARELLFCDISPQTRSAIEKGLTEKKQPDIVAALVLGSPEFQRR